MQTLSDFQKGERVRLADTVRHEDFRGMICTVRRLIKSRNVIEVEGVTSRGFESLYDADPFNVEHLEPFIVPTFSLSDPTRHEFCFAAEQGKPCECERSCADCGDYAMVSAMITTPAGNVICSRCDKRRRTLQAERDQLTMFGQQSLI